MRVNVYAEELTDEVEVVEKVAENTGNKFYGIRVYLHSPEQLHHSDKDDDRSAITFWVPWTQKDGYDFDMVADLFDDMENFARELRSKVLQSIPGNPHYDHTK